jgi:hypothetical protein
MAQPTARCAAGSPGPSGPGSIAFTHRCIVQVTEDHLKFLQTLQDLPTRFQRLFSAWPANSVIGARSPRGLAKILGNEPAACLYEPRQINEKRLHAPTCEKFAKALAHFRCLP